VLRDWLQNRNGWRRGGCQPFKTTPNFLCSTVEFRDYLSERMSGLVLSSFFDFLRLLFAFAMPLSCLSIFFRPKAATGLDARLSPLRQIPAAQASPF
jgi:hypothetical protein